MVHESLRKLSQLMQIPEEMVEGQLPPHILLKRSASLGQPDIDPDRVLEIDLLRWLILEGESLPNLKTLAL